MSDQKPETPAFLIIDMVRDYFDESKNTPISRLARPIIDPINHVSEAFRRNGWPVVFSTNAFDENHFFQEQRLPTPLPAPPERR